MRSGPKRRRVAKMFGLNNLWKKWSKKEVQPTMVLPTLVYLQRVKCISDSFYADRLGTVVGRKFHARFTTYQVKLDDGHVLAAHRSELEPFHSEETSMNCELEQVVSLVKAHLGSAHFGSKSAYRTQYPDRNPVFNAHVLWQDHSGFLQLVHICDLELTEIKPVLLDLFQDLQTAKLPSSLYIYRESTVHNETFNGRPFPYGAWIIRVAHGQITEACS